MVNWLDDAWSLYLCNLLLEGCVWGMGKGLHGIFLDAHPGLLWNFPKPLKQYGHKLRRSCFVCTIVLSLVSDSGNLSTDNIPEVFLLIVCISYLLIFLVVSLAPLGIT